MKNFVLFQILIISALFWGCDNVSDDDNSNDSSNGGDSDTTRDDDERVLYGEFVSTNVTVDGEGYPLVEGTIISLDFSDGALSAHAGCNSIFGTYTNADNVLTVSQLGMTEMGCDLPRHDQDGWLAEVLGASPVVLLISDVLTLTATLADGSQVMIELVSGDQAFPDRAFVGTTWVVDTIFDGDMAGTASWSNPATMTFKDDGSVEVFAGCNSGSGSYVLDAATLTITGLGVTEMACDDSLAMSLEQTVLDLLYNSDTLIVAIDHNRLTLMAGTDGLGLIYPTD